MVAGDGVVAVGVVRVCAAVYCDAGDRAARDGVVAAGVDHDHVFVWLGLPNGDADLSGGGCAGLGLDSD